MAIFSMFSSTVLRFFIWLVILRCSLAIKNANIYYKYYLEDSCTDDENFTYGLSETGIYSVAKIGAFRLPEIHYGVRNCTVTINPPPGYSVYLQIESFRFGISYNRSSGCASYIEVLGNGIKSGKLCGQLKSLPSTSFSTHGNMTVRFHTDDTYPLGGYGFVLIATAYQTYPCTRHNYYVCNNKRCIWHDLICDNIDNCGDSSDEMMFGNSQCYFFLNDKKSKESEIHAAEKELLDIHNKAIQHMIDITVPPFPHINAVDLQPFTMKPINFDNFDVTFSPDIVSFRSSHNISVGAALATAVFVILGAFIRFYCYYQCNQARRRQVLSAVAIIRARTILRPPAMNNVTPPPPYETLVNYPEGQPENPPEYTAASEPVPGNSENSSSAPPPTDKNANVSRGPPPPYEP